MPVYREGNITRELVSRMMRLQADLLRVLVLAVVPGVITLSYQDFGGLGENKLIWQISGVKHSWL